MSIQCCFVNTTEKPVKIVRTGFFDYNIIDNKMLVYEWCEVYYHHPDAPEYAVVSVYKPMSVEIPHGSDDLIKNAINATKAIRAITKLENCKDIPIK